METATTTDVEHGLTTQMFELHKAEQMLSGGLNPVSYTHLDVYKRQGQWRVERRAPANCEAAPHRSGRAAGLPKCRWRNAERSRSVIGDRSLRVNCAQVEAAPAASGCTALLDGTSVERSEAPPEPKASVRRGGERRVKHLYSSVAVSYTHLDVYKRQSVMLRTK